MNPKLLMAAVALVACTGPLEAQAPTQAAARASLVSADRDLAASMVRAGLDAIPSAMAADGALLVPGAPIARGARGARSVLSAIPEGGVVHIAPHALRAVVSADGRYGVTVGVSSISRGASEAVMGRYAAFWTRAADATWRVSVYVLDGLPRPDSGAAINSPELGTPSSPFAAADREFAAVAARSGAPSAFDHFVAPSGMMVSGSGDIVIGREVRERLAQGPAGDAVWTWWPRLSYGDDASDLGATVGEAVIEARDGRSRFYSKYLTVWQRQPGGELRFLVDTGNDRPAGRAPAG